MAEEEEEVGLEVDAVQSVYGDDCKVLQTYPPHLLVHIIPRTADVSSQQFVEAVIGIQAGAQYPQEPPHVDIIESKGLDEQRQKHLVCSIQDKAQDLASCFMLVALCEEAVERLTSMNHPDGDCPLCLHPLLEEHAGDDMLPFMKLMSCFHCFHRECIIRWWNWLQGHKEGESTSSSGAFVRASKDKIHQEGEESIGNCPVCRKVFHVKDIEHVLDLVGAYSQLSLSDVEVDENVLQSDIERIRRQKFEAILKVQEENSGLVDSKKTEVVLLFDEFLPPSPLEPPSTRPPNTSAEETNRRRFKDPKHRSASNSNSYRNRASTSDDRNSGTRRNGRSNSRKEVQQWIKKESGNES